jgi:hypothetical protein
MRISFDLDDTLICYGEEVPSEPRLPLLIRFFLSDEPLRHGTRGLMRALRQRGHEIWIYTSSGRPSRRLRLWFRLHGIHIKDVINSQRHTKCFGEGSLPTKRPHVFGIGMHIDDSWGVADEGERHGFRCFVIAPSDRDWAQKVLQAVDAETNRATSPTA